jgi:hypothetical protein
MNEEDLHVCQQCASLRETLHECEGGCGREICDYCGPLCQDCKDRQEYDRHRKGEDEEDEKSEEQRVFDAKVARERKDMAGRGISGALWDAMDYVFGLADEALANDLECWEGDYDSYTSEEIREMLRIRWTALPAWKKALHKVKKNVDEFAAKAVLNVVQAAKVIEVNTALDPRAVRCWIIEDWAKLNEPDE